MNLEANVNQIIEMAEQVIFNEDIKTKEIETETSIGRAVIGSVRNGKKEIIDISMRNLVELCELNNRIENGEYIIDKKKTEKKINDKKRDYYKLSESQKQQLKDKGINQELYYRRRKMKWTFEEIINTPVREKKHLTDEERELLKEANIDERTFHVRIARGWDRNKALTTPKSK
ncbi:TPA: hypothetical protein ACF5GV_002807 [Staphylococcus aureus]|nr:hypothetical protein [Staphylococcus aureus]